MRGETERANAMLRDLKRAGLKLTPQRMGIVQLFAVDESHPTAQDMFERLRPTFPSLSFATVYNTLDTLARAGLAGIVRLPGKRGDAARFDPNSEPHHHAVCDQCGAVIDIAAGTLAPTAAARKRVRRAAPGFSVRAVERIYRGLCPQCAQEGISQAVSGKYRSPSDSKNTIHNNEGEHRWPSRSRERKPTRT